MLLNFSFALKFAPHPQEPFKSTSLCAKSCGFDCLCLSTMTTRAGTLYWTSGKIIFIPSGWLPQLRSSWSCFRKFLFFCHIFFFFCFLLLLFFYPFVKSWLAVVANTTMKVTRKIKTKKVISEVKTKIRKNLVLLPQLSFSLWHFHKIDPNL